MNPSNTSAKSNGGRGNPKSKVVSRSVKAGLQFPVGRVARFLKKWRYAHRVGSGSPEDWDDKEFISDPEDKKPECEIGPERCVAPSGAFCTSTTAE